ESLLQLQECDRGLFGGHPSQFDVVDHDRSEDSSLAGPADQAIDGHDEKHHGGNTEEWQRFFGTAALSRQLAVSGLGTESSADGAVSLIPLDVDCRSASVAGGVTPQSPATGRSGVGLAPFDSDVSRTRLVPFVRDHRRWATVRHLPSWVAGVLGCRGTPSLL